MWEQNRTLVCQKNAYNLKLLVPLIVNDSMHMANIAFFVFIPTSELSIHPLNTFHLASVFDVAL